MILNRNTCNILWYGDNVYPEDTSLHTHFHLNYYQIYFIIGGGAEFKIGKTVHTVNKGMYVLIRPNRMHGIITSHTVNNASLRMQEIKFTIDDEAFQNRVYDLPPTGYFDDELIRLTKSIYDESFDRLPLSYELACTHLCNLLLNILRQRKIEQRAQNKNSKKALISNEIKGYIQQHYKEDVSLEQLAVQMGYSKNYLCQVFKDENNDTINGFLNLCRVNAAAEMLCNTQLDMQTICQSAGFHSVFHFIKTFKKYTGLPPGNYRQLIGVGMPNKPVKAYSAVFRKGILSPLLSAKKTVDEGAPFITLTGNDDE